MNDSKYKEINRNNLQQVAELESKLLAFFENEENDYNPFYIRTVLKLLLCRFEQLLG